ncbi:LuxR C-terminal-related transcriptional regulator [Nocardiopsis mangrovi]|uniref:LuxR C-terminal-related transcriptional regulator n=1 Tax=Nocardiopsis mangrovi TaxID=1179818 RepID=A0ABV9E5T3_9ACTN
MPTSIESQVSIAPSRARSPSTPWSHFPTPIIGRRRELAHLNDRLHAPEVRMLTLTGPVGVGKSRLAATALLESGPLFGAGATYIDLHASRGTGLWPALDAASRPPPGSGTGAACRTLLAVDSCDDVFSELPDALTRLLADREEIVVLVAAPEPLGVYGEEVVRVAPLPVPAVDGPVEDLHANPSVRLFVQRARAVRPGFRLTPDNSAAVARLCVRTGGLPLALELAAGRMKVNSPKGVLDALDTNLDVLSGGGGETLSRHTGMREAITGALTRLDRSQQELLGRIAVFHTGADLHAAVAVAGRPTGETRQRLERLVDMGLLLAEECEDGAVSFALLSLTRQCVLEWLEQSGLDTEFLHAHAGYFLAGVEEVEPGDGGAVPQRAPHWRHDVQAAAEFLLDSGARSEAIRLATVLGTNWGGNGTLHAATDLLRRALAAPGAAPRTILDGQSGLGELLTLAGDFDLGERLLREALRGFGDLGDGAGAALAGRRLGTLALNRGDTVQAEELLRRATNALGTAGVARQHAFGLRELARCLRVRERPSAAAQAARHAAALFEGIGDTRDAAEAESVLADAVLSSGKPAEAERRHREVLGRLATMGDRGTRGVVLERLALARVALPGAEDAELRRSAREFGAASVIRESTGWAVPAPLAAEMRQAVARVTARLGEADFERCREQGRGADRETVLGEALVPPAVRAAPPRRAQRDARVHPLTARELQVAELVAAGLTNREIARRLSISEWTAINHLRKIMRKLDCSSRVHVAGWFARTRRREDPSGTASSSAASD